MSDLSLVHWHDAGYGPGGTMPPPRCCVDAFTAVNVAAAEEIGRDVADAVRAERARIVADLVAGVRAYAQAAASVLADPGAQGLVRSMAEQVELLVRRVGCVCPQVDVSTFDGKVGTVTGFAPGCGAHEQVTAP